MAIAGATPYFGFIKREILRPMREAAIVATARTPIGKAHRGALNNIHGATLAAHSISAAVARAEIGRAHV